MLWAILILPGIDARPDPTWQSMASRQEPVFVLGVIRIVDQAGALVEKNGLCLFEADSVIRLISARRATAPEEEVYWRLR
jgi:hypothetical protein